MCRGPAPQTATPTRLSRCSTSTRAPTLPKRLCSGWRRKHTLRGILRAIVWPGRSSSSRVSRRCLRATAWTLSRRLTASTASPMPRPSVSAAHRSATSPSCSGPVSTHQGPSPKHVLTSLPNPCMCSQTETTRARSRRQRRRRWSAGGRWPTRCGIAAGAVRISPLAIWLRDSYGR